MSTKVVQIAAEDDARAWGILVRHSPGVSLPDRVVVISAEAVTALQDAGIRFTILNSAAVSAHPPGVPASERV